MVHRDGGRHIVWIKTVDAPGGGATSRSTTTSWRRRAGPAVLLTQLPASYTSRLDGRPALPRAALRLLRGRPAKPPWRVEVPIASGAIATGRRAADMGIERTQEYRLRAIMRHGELVPAAEALEAGDRLVFAASEVGVTTLWESPRFGLSPQHLYAVSVGPGEHGTLLEFEDDDLRVIAAQTAKPLGDTTAIPGATVFVTCSSTEDLARHEAFTLWAQAAGRVPQPGKTWTALGVLAAVVVAASFGLAPVELVAFAGALLMVLTRVLTPRIGRASPGLERAVHPGRIRRARCDRRPKRVGRRPGPFDRAALRGESARRRRGVRRDNDDHDEPHYERGGRVDPHSRRIGIATELGLDPVTVLALVATCISFTFINPFSHQSNLMVMGPGGYSTRTFAKFGAPLVAVSLATVSVVTWALLNPG